MPTVGLRLLERNLKVLAKASAAATTSSAPVELVECVLGDGAEMDLLPIVFARIRIFDLGSLLDCCTLVCKSWRRVIQLLPTPQAKLRFAWENRVALSAKFREEWDLRVHAEDEDDDEIDMEFHPVILAYRDALFLTDDTDIPCPHVKDIAKMTRRCLQRGGWREREVRRKKWHHVWCNGKEYSPLPSQLVHWSHWSPSEGRWLVTKREAMRLRAASERGDVKEWVEHFEKKDPIAQSTDFFAKASRHMVGLIGLSATGEPRHCIYLEVQPAGEWSRFHPVLLRLPYQLFQDYFANKRLLVNDKILKAVVEEEGAAVCPIKSQWELIG